MAPGDVFCKKIQEWTQQVVYFWNTDKASGRFYQSDFATSP